MWLNPEHGVELNRLGAQLVWATTREHKANTMIGPAIGLPNLPVITFGAEQASSSWKYAAVDRYAAGRPLAWLDDDFDLFPTARDGFLDPRTGITREHLTAVEKWIDSL